MPRDVTAAAASWSAVGGELALLHRIATSSAAAYLPIDEPPEAEVLHRARDRADVGRAARPLEDEVHVRERHGARSTITSG
jgi:hypothetical protein